jgi:hypothetical protein
MQRKIAPPPPLRLISTVAMIQRCILLYTMLFKLCTISVRSGRYPAVTIAWPYRHTDSSSSCCCCCCCCCYCSSQQLP